jgi:hypothetical protein
VEGTWTTTENLITDLPINPTFAAKPDMELIEPMADYFPPTLQPELPGDLDSSTNLFYKSEEGEK